MAKLKLLSTIFSKLGSLTKNNGQIIVTRDSKSLYVDLEGERIEITDWIDVDTEETLLSILTPLTNKYYYTKDSNKIWRYINNDWECLNTSVNDLTPTYTESSNLVKLSSGEKLSVAFGKISKAITDLISHIGDSVKHITSTERTNWNSAKTHADSTHAPADAQKNVQSDWSATSGDAYIKNKPTEFPPSIHTHTKSEISDFPSSLPASGGNADTVNNHTVKSNVPTDAVFTDTIYDDTEVKESIAELNSNLDGLQYGDTHGGYNIFKDTTWVVGRNIAENGISNYLETGSAYSDYISIVEPNTYYISSFTHPKFTVFEYDANKSFIKYNGWKKDNNTPCVLSGNCAYIRISFSGASSNIQPSNVMLAKTPNLPYVPYIPSVKMLSADVAELKNDLSNFTSGQYIDGSTDWNTIKTSGMYYYNGWSGSGGSNKPTETKSIGMAFVLNTGNTLLQFVVLESGNSYFRSGTVDELGNWVTIS